jgi:hypothetical protein
LFFVGFNYLSFAILEVPFYSDKPVHKIRSSIIDPLISTRNIGNKQLSITNVKS